MFADDREFYKLLIVLISILCPLLCNLVLVNTLKLNEDKTEALLLGPIHTPSRSLRSSADSRIFRNPSRRRKFQGQRAFSNIGPVI